MNPVVRKLIAKELYLYRWLIAVTVFSGLVCLGVSCLGRISFGIGSIMFLTVVVAYGCVLPMFSITSDRKEKSVVFVLSLPISRADYRRSKMAGVLLSFLIPWCVLLAAAVVVIKASLIPDGMILLTVLLMGLVLTNFCLIVSVLMVTASETFTILLILCTNVSVTFFIVGLTNLTSIGPASARQTLVWDTAALTVLGCEAAAIVVLTFISVWTSGREPDIV